MPFASVRRTRRSLCCCEAYWSILEQGKRQETAVHDSYPLDRNLGLFSTAVLTTTIGCALSP